MRLATTLSAISALAAASCASAALSVGDVSARQRWPWNGLVDVDFSISGAADGDVFAIDVSATYDGGTKALAARTFLDEPLAGAGANRVVWDLAADCPEFRAEDLVVSVTATPLSADTPVYMKIDLSPGPDAAKYPVRYSLSGPAHVRGAMDEPCQTTELWLRRIPRHDAAIPFHRFSYTDSSADNFYGRLTKDYYIGVFELTQRQFELVAGTNPSFFTNETYRASRPVEMVNGALLYGGNANIHLHPESVAADSFFGRLRARTGLPLAVPSSMQFEYALRGGYYTGEYYRYKIRNDAGALYVPAQDQIGRWTLNVATTSPDGSSDAASGTAVVGSYLPNLFGLYDTMGNVYELTCEYVKDWASRGMSVDLAALREAAGDDTLGKSAANPVVDYFGMDKSGSCWRTMGGSYAKGTLTIWAEGWYMSQLLNPGISTVGLRVSMNVE